MVEAKAKGLILGVVSLVLLIAILAGVTPTVLTYLDNLSATYVANGVSLGSLLATDQLGGILWFVLGILIVLGSVFVMIRSAGSGK